MPGILVRNMDKELMDRLKRQAKRNGRSLQAEVKQILERAASEPKLDHEASLELADEIRSRLGDRTIPDSAELIREARDR